MIWEGGLREIIYIFGNSGNKIQSPRRYGVLADVSAVLTGSLLFQHVSHRVLQLHQAARHAAAAPAAPAPLPRRQSPLPRPLSLLLPPRPLRTPVPPARRLRVFQPVPQSGPVPRQAAHRAHPPGALLPERRRRRSAAVGPHDPPGQRQAAGQQQLDLPGTVPTPAGGQLRPVLGVTCGYLSEGPARDGAGFSLKPGRDRAMWDPSSCAPALRKGACFLRDPLLIRGK